MLIVNRYGGSTRSHACICVSVRCCCSEHMVAYRQWDRRKRPSPGAVRLRRAQEPAVIVQVDSGTRKGSAGKLDLVRIEKSDGRDHRSCRWIWRNATGLRFVWPQKNA